MMRSALGILTATALAGLAGLALSPPADAHPAYHPWGRASAPDQVLRQGCHRYDYTYRLHPPTDEWSAEIFLVNPHHHTIASAALDSGSDKPSGAKSWTLCYYSTVSGTYKIKMKITYNVDRDVHDGYVRPTTFRLTDGSHHGR